MSEDVVEVMARALCQRWGDDPNYMAFSRPGGERVPAWQLWIPDVEAALSALTEGGWEVRKVQDSSRDHAPTTCAASVASDVTGQTMMGTVVKLREPFPIGTWVQVAGRGPIMWVAAAEPETSWVSCMWDDGRQARCADFHTDDLSRAPVVSK